MLITTLKQKAVPVKAGTAFLALSLACAGLGACDSRAGGERGTQGASASARPIYERGPSTLGSVDDSVGQFLSRAKGRALTYYRISDGMHMGTPSEHDADYALSLIKLYIATYVVEHGSFADTYDALDMVANSSDLIAEELFEKYPDSIEVIAKEYGLAATTAGETWGKSKTSTYDVVSFIAALRQADPTHPVLVAMAHADEISADGYLQDYGTATLRGVVGTKWGWSDDKDLHSSVSFGEDFVVAAYIEGSAEELTAFVQAEVTDKNKKKGAERMTKALRGELTTTATPSARRTSPVPSRAQESKTPRAAERETTEPKSTEPKTSGSTAPVSSTPAR